MLCDNANRAKMISAHAQERLHNFYLITDIEFHTLFMFAFYVFTNEISTFNDILILATKVRTHLTVG